MSTCRRCSEARSCPVSHTPLVSLFGVRRENGSAQSHPGKPSDGTCRSGQRLRLGQASPGQCSGTTCHPCIAAASGRRETWARDDACRVFGRCEAWAARAHDLKKRQWRPTLRCQEVATPAALNSSCQDTASDRLCHPTHPVPLYKLRGTHNVSVSHSLADHHECHSCQEFFGPPPFVEPPPVKYDGSSPRRYASVASLIAWTSWGFFIARPEGVEDGVAHVYDLLFQGHELLHGLSFPH